MKFFDTNILVYVADIRDPQKQRIAEDLVAAALGLYHKLKRMGIRHSARAGESDSKAPSAMSTRVSGKPHAPTTWFSKGPAGMKAVMGVSPSPSTPPQRNLCKLKPTKHALMGARSAPHLLMGRDRCPPRPRLRLITDLSTIKRSMTVRFLAFTRIG